MTATFQLNGQEFMALDPFAVECRANFLVCPCHPQAKIRGKLESLPYTDLKTDLNGGPRFKFTEAISFVVNCETQQEVDELWEKLSEGGEKGRCGWLKDKYGLSWQVNPTVLGEMLQD